MLFWDNFSRICEERGTKPTPLLKEIGITPNKVTVWKNGSLPKQEVLIELARYLKCSVADFFEDGKSCDYEVKLTEDERDLVEIFRSMPRAEKHKTLARLYEYQEAFHGKIK